METHLADWLKGTPDGETAEAILRTCVHCGFCTATCPTYQLLGDELDGPRGRIYLIKQVIEGGQPTAATQMHLDRCLTCRNCETTCPSGVQYGHLVDIGRKLVDEAVPRPPAQRLLRFALREFTTRRWLFDPMMRMGRLARPWLPATLRAKVPAARLPGAWPSATQARKVILLNGCVQPAMLPAIDAATARVLDRLSYESLVVGESGCCGAIRLHLGDQDGALANVRRNIDAWWPLVAGGDIAAIVMNASGCGATVKEYAYLMRNDPDYARKAQRIVELTRDLAEFLPPLADEIEPLVHRRPAHKVTFHSPCSLQHGQQVRHTVETLLTRLGVDLAPVVDSHLCCGSAGTYSVTQPVLSRQLRDRKLAGLTTHGAQEILSANVGCITHLQSGTEHSVRHWVEWLDEAMRPG